MMNVACLNFPELNEAFENTTNVNDACLKYINILNSTDSFYNSQYSNRLSKFLDVEIYIDYLESEYYALKTFLRKWSKANKVNVILKMRRKSFIGYNEKIRLYLSSGKDLSLIRDLIGFRLVLCTGSTDSVETHHLCCKLMNDILRFLALERKCLLLDAHAQKTFVKTINLTTDITNKIFISDVDDILPEFKRFVENYMLYPKTDGYQGLHACIESSLPFEIQVKSFAMDCYADSIHSKYKSERYENTKIFLDLSKININGVAFDETGHILSDYSGLFKGLDLFNRL